MLDNVMHLQAESSGYASTSGRPDFLQRVLDSGTGALQDMHQLMLLTMHSVLLETGMQLADQVSLGNNLICCGSTYS